MARRTTSLVKLALFAAAAVVSPLLVATANARTASGEASTSRALVDSARRDGGRSGLAFDARLERVARAQSAQMAQQGRVFHNTRLGRDVSAAGVDWRWVGENVGVGPDAGLIHQGFMDSPPHRDVLMRAEATAFGVGAVIGPDGRLYITQVYARIVAAEEPVAVDSHMRAAPESAAPERTPSVRPARMVVVRSPDPNAVIGGVVTETLSELSTDEQRAWTTRSDLRAS